MSSLTNLANKAYAERFTMKSVKNLKSSKFHLLNLSKFK